MFNIKQFLNNIYVNDVKNGLCMIDDHNDLYNMAIINNDLTILYNISTNYTVENRLFNSTFNFNDIKLLFNQKYVKESDFKMIKHGIKLNNVCVKSVNYNKQYLIDFCYEEPKIMFILDTNKYDEIVNNSDVEFLQFERYNDGVGLRAVNKRGYTVDYITKEHIGKSQIGHYITKFHINKFKQIRKFLKGKNSFVIGLIEDKDFLKVEIDNISIIIASYK